MYSLLIDEAKEIQSAITKAEDKTPMSGLKSKKTEIIPISFLLLG